MMPLCLKRHCLSYDAFSCNQQNVRCYIYIKKIKCNEKEDEKKPNANPNPIVVDTGDGSGGSGGSGGPSGWGYIINDPTGGGGSGGGGRINVPPLEVKQYTPANTESKNIGVPCMEAATALSLKVNKGHDPDGITWLDYTNWPKWDGVPLNTCGKTTNEICKWVFPSINTMRGLRDLFYSLKPPPFADNTKPTIAEIDTWNIQVIQHFRNLIGAKQEIKPDRCLFLRAYWGDERKLTDIWNQKYPVDTCVGSTNEHCGATFLPSCQDQLPYLDGNPCCDTLPAGAEGVFSVKMDLPWSIKLSRVIGDTLCREGLTGHTGPFVGRELVGLSFACQDGSHIVRAKWGGNLQPLSCP